MWSSKHDVTAYSEKGLREKGKLTFQVNWQGVGWVFASQAQRDLSAQNPEKYTPAYNGFCSNALVQGEGLIRTSEEVWHIFEGQLHMFFADRSRQAWLNGDYKTLKPKTDKAWLTELAKLK